MSLEAFANYNTTPIINFWKEIGYNEDEIEEICCFIMEMRKKYGQKLEQIQSSYMPGSYLKTIKYKR